jgi:hypothetical protein
MPLKADPRDWDRLFRPNAPRRGGPLRVFANVMMLLVVISILGVGGVFASRQISVAQQAAAVTAEARATQASAAATAASATAAAVALANTATTEALRTPTEVAPDATSAPVPSLGRSVVINGGNLRSEPVVVPETVIGQICANDEVEVLEDRTVEGGARWYLIRVTNAPVNCTAQRVSIGSSGWASSTLLAPVTP